MSNFQASQLNESLLTFDYNLLQQEIENTINADYIDDECFDDHYDVEMNDESEFDREVPITDKFDKIEVTPCVIIDNENDEEKIKRCNSVDKIRSIHNLIGSFEIDSNAVKEVGDEFERLDFKPKLSTISTETDSISISTESSDNQTIPNFFLLNVVFAVKKLNLNEYQEVNQLNPEVFKNYGKTLATSIWQSRTTLQKNESSLESPGSLDEFHESIPGNLTSFFNGLLSTLQCKKLKVVNDKRKQRDLPILELNVPTIKKIVTFLASIVLTFAFPLRKIWTTQIMSSLCQNHKLLPYLYSILQSSWHATLRVVFQFKLPNFAIMPTDINEIMQSPMFGEGQYIAEWIERFNDVFSTLLKDSESLKELIGTVQSERERMLMLYDEFVDDNTVSKHPRAVRDHKQALWKLVDEILQAFNDDIPEKSILFKEATQLTSGGYQLMFTCYDKGVGRLKKIVDQDIDMTQIRNTVGRRRKELVPLEVKDLGKLKSNYGEEMEIETNLEQDISINEINMEDQVPPIIEPSFSMQINEATVTTNTRKHKPTLEELKHLKILEDYKEFLPAAVIEDLEIKLKPYTDHWTKKRIRDRWYDRCKRNKKPKPLDTSSNEEIIKKIVQWNEEIIN
ncbi:10965_t:CDS:2 [Entrophospora sp. SA101]|nr:10965_t:CDS:2 [Entrophospora sp. SA101]